MAIGIDTSNRKPRRSFGTPLYRFRDYIALSVVGIGAVIGAIYVCTPGLKLRQYFIKYLEESNKADELRKPLIGLMEPRSPAKVVQDSEEELMNTH